MRNICMQLFYMRLNQIKPSCHRNHFHSCCFSQSPSNWCIEEYIRSWLPSITRLNTPLLN